MPYSSYNKTEVAEAVDQVDVEPATNGEAKEMPAWLSKIKEGGVKKVPKDVQKRRRNFRLKKMLAPKPPLMVLTELVQPSQVQFDNFIVDPLSQLLKIRGHYDGKTFEGLGPNKPIAKNICCEQILQHIAFKSCIKDAESPLETRTGSHGEEETPWSALASVALFKLFNDWQSQGAVLPAELLRAQMSTNSKELPNFPFGSFSDAAMNEAVEAIKSEPKVPKKRMNAAGEPRQLPDNPLSRHPVQLLNEMETELDYTATMTGTPPNCVFQMTVKCHGGQTFTGSARNKKDAKKIAAQNALAAIYNVIYPQ